MKRSTKANISSNVFSNKLSVDIAVDCSKLRDSAVISSYLVSWNRKNHNQNMYEGCVEFFYYLSFLSKEYNKKISITKYCWCHIYHYAYEINALCVTVQV